MERRAIAIHGTVQGVGFRPFVYGLASRLQLGGFVQNRDGGVQIEIEGDADPLDQFVSQLVSGPPPLAHIDDVSWQRRSPRGDRLFYIKGSEQSNLAQSNVAVSPDVGTCDDCLAELFNPQDRRYRYPFINCTNCGPRLTIVTGAPYDRERTTMAGFHMCHSCRAEYESPTDRRFHAQPNACPVCGPRLQVLDAGGNPIGDDDPLKFFADILRRGGIGAMKGLGGYHLVCDARNNDVVAQLRTRKYREEKPFAAMVADIDGAADLCELSTPEEKLLMSFRRPIVLLRKRESADVAESVAPGNPSLGVMLPYTPLHHLLLHDMGGQPLVMTSGNRSDEPISFHEPDAIERLRGIADVFLVHDRPIHLRCDDSVTRIVGGIESPIRRSRGYAPQSIALPLACPVAILAVGGQLKATFALGSERRAIVSHHMGDLDHFGAFAQFTKDITLFEQLFSIQPTYLAHDMHPDYASTRYATEREAESGIKRVPVQHHHAHMASCMAEHGLSGPVIGVTFDGSGYGPDDAIWGGEFLVGDYRSFKRAAHLRYVGLPGGEQAVREPWRMAASYLSDAEACCATFEERIPAQPLKTARRMIERQFNTPMTSSAGRLFDAVASLIGLRDRVNYEGQAAIQLEWLAETSAEAGSYPFDIQGCAECVSDEDAMVIDVRPMIRSIVADLAKGVSSALIALQFHSTIAEIIGDVCQRLHKSIGIDTVVFSGGVFMNALLSTQATERLTSDGFHVHCHRVVPANDGGLSLGQLAVAASQLTPAT